MAKRKGTHWVVSAALVDSGSPVYLGGDRSWVNDLAEARAVELDSDRDAMLEAAAGDEAVVCDPYAFEVVLDDGLPTALSVREQIRRNGPSTPVRRAD